MFSYVSESDVTHLWIACMSVVSLLKVSKLLCIWLYVHKEEVASWLDSEMCSTEWQ